MKLNKLSLSSLLIASTITALTGCGQDKQATDTNAAAPAEATGDVITIATEGSYPPFSLTNSDGTLGGFDVELVNALCADMKANCEVIAQDWDGLISGLIAGKYQVVADAISITPERQEKIDFSEPYFDNTLVFIAKKDHELDPQNKEQVLNSKVAVQRSTIGSQWVEDTYPEVEAQAYETITNAFLDLDNGRVDTLITDKTPAIEWLKSEKAADFEVKGEEIDINDKFALAFQKDSELPAQFNEALAHLKENGKYDELVAKYFEVAK